MPDFNKELFVQAHAPKNEYELHIRKKIKKNWSYFEYEASTYQDSLLNPKKIGIGTTLVDGMLLMLS